MFVEYFWWIICYKPFKISIYIYMNFLAFSPKLVQQRNQTASTVNCKEMNEITE